MSNENGSIHDFDFNLICEYFSHMERQGPGSPGMTLKALSFIEPLTHSAHIADIGCGTGGQTITLAQHCPGRITGIDLFPTFIDLFNRNAAALSLQERVKGVQGDMAALPFAEEELDLIWSEGAIYNIGFEKGVNEWRRFLKKGGYLAVTEASWFTVERPAEIHDFWMDAYPEIDTISRCVAKMEQAGYLPVATFILPEECWTHHFYAPQPAVQEAFLRKHAGNLKAELLISELRREEAMYDKYKAYYGYVFYIGKKL